MKSTITLSIGICLVLAFGGNSVAQTIQQQYEELYEQSSTWEDYKVIKLDRIGSFWSVMTDSLQQKQRMMQEARREIDALESDVASTQAQLDETVAALEASEQLNDSIGFIGIQMGKTVYNIILWSIIVALAVAVSIIYLMFNRSNMVTRKTRKEYAHLEVELKKQKDKSREMQIKLKRELQTALNALNEQRV